MMIKYSPKNLIVTPSNFDFAGSGIYNAFIDGTQRATNTTYSTKLDTSQTLGMLINRSLNLVLRYFGIVQL